MNIEYQRLNHITIAVPAGEHKKVRDFYGGILGLKEIQRPNALDGVYDLIWYQCMEFLIHIDFTPPWTQPAENRHLAIEVQHLSPIRTYLKSKGVKLREAIPIPDRERVYVIDPFGNYFEFIEFKTR